MAGKKISSNRIVLKKITKTKTKVNKSVVKKSLFNKPVSKKNGPSKESKAIRSAVKPAAKKESVSNIVKKEMTIGEAIEKYPESAQIMLQHGLHCIGCHVATWETIEQGASAHGIDSDKLIHDINKEISKKNR
jgi:hybrid cluster-associated redox disulfide protein